MITQLFALFLAHVASAPADQTGGALILPNPKTIPKHYAAQASGAAQPARAEPSAAAAAHRAQVMQLLAQQKAAALAQPAAAQLSTQGLQQGHPLALPTTLTLSGSDDCASADPIFGTGTFNFDNTLATSGADTGLYCGSVYNDVWFDWTCPASGVCTWSLCGGAGVDTIIGVFAGSGCPAWGSALFCNDDSCMKESTIHFGCTAGLHYTLQLGGFNNGSDVTAGTFTLNVTTPPANDNCNTPTLISGTGNFTFDNSLATTGTQGQNEAACTGGAYSVTIEQDVWYQWTAPATGSAVLSSCGLTTAPTELVVYAGTGCPLPGSAIACNVFACNMQALVVFPATAGSTYTIQLGADTMLQGGTGWFALNVLPTPPNDDCSTPLPITGTGVYFFDNFLATAGSQGQTESLCSQWGLTSIDHDLWYSWTAPASACTLVSTCGSTLDSKLAVYPGGTCPLPGSALACNDDACGAQSSLRFTAAAGQNYLLQVGTKPALGLGGTGMLDIKQIAGGIGNDECSGATAIGGLGTFPFDNSSATTGCEGQSEPLCGASYGFPAIDNDVWFTWVAPVTGTASLETCNGTNVNTKVAVYLGGGCPTPGGALACADDVCGPNYQQESIAWSCVAGATYLIQLGCSPGNAGGQGTFDLTAAAPPANDNCSTPDPIMGSGTYFFTLFGASTGTEGQNESLCASSSGATAIENDVWFDWTAPTSGYVVLSLCSGSNFDSKLAVYATPGCPVPGTALVCDDNYCWVTSQVCFDVLGGEHCMIQIGTAPGFGATSASGSFTITLTPPRPSCAYDDGTMESMLGLGGGGDLVWLNRFGAPGVTTVLSSVDVLWGSAALPGFNPGNGTPTDVCIWQDGVSQDGDPSDASLLLQIPTTVSNVDTDTYVNFPITPLSINGYYFVGSHQQHDGTYGGGVQQYVAPIDATGCIADGASWFFANTSGLGSSADLTNPGNNLWPPHMLTGLPFHYEGQWGVRAGCSGGPATFLCIPGIAGVIPCPCGNPPTGGERGCDNSSSTGGAALSAWGTNSITAADLYFTSAGERPTATSVLLQGASALASGTAFGQGVRCFGGPLKRLYVKTASGGSILAPNLTAGDLSIPARSAMLGSPLSAGQDRYYMVYYRDPVVLGGCAASATFNGTNTAKVTWQP